jgi:hypothetical protein
VNPVSKAIKNSKFFFIAYQFLVYSLIEWSDREFPVAPWFIIPPVL